MLPTTKTIDTQLNIVSDDAKLVREVLDKAEDTTRERFRLWVESQPEQFPETCRWLLHACRYRDPSKVDLALRCVDEIIYGYGVEAIFEQDAMQPVLSYVNTGDAYNPTICYRHDIHRFVLSCWGDEVERLENKGFDIA